MRQAEKSHESRELILEAARYCFAHQGFRGTSLKDIASRAGISIGRVYHHFTTKDELFTELLERYWAILRDPELPLNRVLFSRRFPDDFEELVFAIRDVVQANRESILLIYIDVIEFQGEHVQRIYRQMVKVFRQVFEARFRALEAEGKLAPGADPLVAVMMVVRFFFQYFTVETCFGVEHHFGLDTETMVQKAKSLFLHGLLHGDPSLSPTPNADPEARP